MCRIDDTIIIYLQSLSRVVMSVYLLMVYVYDYFLTDLGQTKKLSKRVF